MRPQTQTDHSECSNRKPLGFEDSRDRSRRQFLNHEESYKVNLVTQAVWSRSNWAVHVPREMTLIACANGED